jgi:hypothetical protein
LSALGEPLQADQGEAKNAKGLKMNTPNSIASTRTQTCGSMTRRKLVFNQTELVIVNFGSEDNETPSAAIITESGSMRMHDCITASELRLLASFCTAAADQLEMNSNQ